MPDTEIDRSLEQLLAYPETTPRDDERFVVDVMQKVRKERRTRQLILLVFGLVGALFGAIGAMLLSDGISRLFTEVLSGTVIMQLALFISGIAAFYVWFMGDDLPLEGGHLFAQGRAAGGRGAVDPSGCTVRAAADRSVRRIRHPLRLPGGQALHQHA